MFLEKKLTKKHRNSLEVQPHEHSFFHLAVCDEGQWRFRFFFCSCRSIIHNLSRRGDIKASNTQQKVASKVAKFGFLHYMGRYSMNTPREFKRATSLKQGQEGVEYGVKFDPISPGLAFLLRLAVRADFKSTNNSGGILTLFFRPTCSSGLPEG